MDDKIQKIDATATTGLIDLFENKYLPEALKIASFLKECGGNSADFALFCAKV